MKGKKKYTLYKHLLYTIILNIRKKEKICFAYILTLYCYHCILSNRPYNTVQMTSKTAGKHFVFPCYDTCEGLKVLLNYSVKIFKSSIIFIINMCRKCYVINCNENYEKSAKEKAFHLPRTPVERKKCHTNRQYTRS